MAGNSGFFLENVCMGCGDAVQNLKSTKYKSCIKDYCSNHMSETLLSYLVQYREEAL